MAFMDPADFPARTLDEDAFTARMLAASIPATDRVQKPEPGFDELIRAAFRTSNTLVSAINSKGLAENLFPTRDATPIAPSTILADLKAKGLGHHANLFTDVDTKEMYDARVSDLQQELLDRHTLHASGGLLAEIAAGVFDPINLVPIAGGVAKAGAGARAIAKASAIGAAGSAVLTEGVLQQTQVTRDWKEGVSNVAAATVFGVGLGFGAAGLARMLGAKTARAVESTLDTKIVDITTGGAKTVDDIKAVAPVHQDLLPTGPLNKELKPIERAEPELKGTSADNAEGAFVASDAKAGASAGAAVTDAGRDRNVYTASDRADARLFGVVSIDGMMKAIPNIIRKVPYIGEAVGQGLRNPRLELQDAISPTAREIVQRLDENPYITKAEARGDLQVDGLTFSQVYREIEGGHAMAIKEINDVWALNKAEFNGDRKTFGQRVFFAAINDGKDAASSAAVERAANAYKSRVFDPILKHFQDSGLLVEGVNVRGANGYVPWVHVAEAIMKDKENFIARHTEAFSDALKNDFYDAMDLKIAHDAKTAVEKEKIVQARDDAIAKVKETYDGVKGASGQKDKFGKIDEHAQDFDRKLEDLRLKRDEDLDKAKAKRDDGVAADKPGAKNAYNVEVGRIKERYDIAVRRAKEDAKRRDKELRAERDAKIAEAKEQAKSDIKSLDKLSGEITNELLRLNSEEKIAERAAKLANDYYAGAVSGADHLMLGENPRDKLLPSVLKARRSPILQKEAAEKGWAETNIFDLAESYHRNAGAAAAMSAVFKKPELVSGKPTGKLVADINLTEAIGQVKKDFQRAIDASGGGDTELKLRQAQTETIKNIEIMRDGLLGRRDTFGSQAMQKTADLAMQFNSWRLMGGTVLSSLTDPANIVIANGFSNTWRHGIVPALNNLKAYWGKIPAEEMPAHLRSLKLAGAVIEREKNAMLGAMMDLHNPSGTADKTQVFARNLSKRFWDWSGLTGWTTLWKNIGSSVADARIMDMASRGWADLSTGERAWLANLRVDEDILGRVKTMHDTQAQKYSAGIPYGAFDEWSDKLVASRFADALNREAKNLVVTPTVGDRLAFQSTAPGQVIGQFKSFGVANQSRVVARNAALSNLDGGNAANLYGGMVLLGFLGVAVDSVKFLAGDSSVDGSSKKNPNKSALDMLIKKWTETPGEQAYNVLDRTSVFMPLTEPSNILQKLGLPNLQGAFSIALRDKENSRSGSSRFMHRSVGEAALGPTFGLLEDAAKIGALGTGFGKYMVGINENFKPTSSDFARARRFFPFQNAPGIQQIINWGHQHVGTAYDWPKD